MVAQTAWIERKFDFNFPAGMFPVILERLNSVQYRLPGMLETVPEKILSVKHEDKWSVKEHIGHLYDLEELWYGRIEDFLAGKEILRAADMTNTRTREANHNSKPLDQLLSQFFQARGKLVSMLEPMDEKTVLLSALHPRLLQSMRLVDSIFFVAEHDDHHLATIRSLLENRN